MVVLILRITGLNGALILRSTASLAIRASRSFHSPIRRHRSCADLLSPLPPSPNTTSQPPLSLIFSIRPVTDPEATVETICSPQTLLTTQLLPLDDVKESDVQRVLETCLIPAWRMGSKSRVEEPEEERLEDALVHDFVGINNISVGTKNSPLRERCVSIATILSNSVELSTGICDHPEEPHPEIKSDVCSLLSFQTLDRSPTPDVHQVLRPEPSFAVVETSLAEVPALPPTQPLLVGTFPSPLIDDSPLATTSITFSSPSSIQSPYTPASSSQPSMVSLKSVEIPSFPSPIPFENEDSFDSNAEVSAMCIDFPPSLITSTPSAKTSDRTSLGARSSLSPEISISSSQPSPPNKPSISRLSSVSSLDGAQVLHVTKSVGHVARLLPTASTATPRLDAHAPSSHPSFTTRLKTVVDVSLGPASNPDSPRILDKQGHREFRRVANLVGFTCDSDSSAVDSDNSFARLERRRSAPFLSVAPSPSSRPPSAHYYTGDTSFTLSDYCPSPPSSSPKTHRRRSTMLSPSSHASRAQPDHSNDSRSSLFSLEVDTSNTSLDNFRARLHSALQRGTRSFGSDQGVEDDLMDLSDALSCLGPTASSEVAGKGSATSSTPSSRVVARPKKKARESISFLSKRRSMVLLFKSGDNTPVVSSPLTKVFASISPSE